MKYTRKETDKKNCIEELWNNSKKPNLYVIEVHKRVKGEQRLFGEIMVKNFSQIEGYKPTYPRSLMNLMHKKQRKLPQRASQSNCSKPVINGKS